MSSPCFWSLPDLESHLGALRFFTSDETNVRSRIGGFAHFFRGFFPKQRADTCSKNLRKSSKIIWVQDTLGPTGRLIAVLSKESRVKPETVHHFVKRSAEGKLDPVEDLSSLHKKQQNTIWWDDWNLLQKRLFVLCFLMFFCMFFLMSLLRSVLGERVSAFDSSESWIVDDRSFPKDLRDGWPAVPAMNCWWTSIMGSNGIIAGILWWFNGI